MTIRPVVHDSFLVIFDSSSESSLCLKLGSIEPVPGIVYGFSQWTPMREGRLSTLVFRVHLDIIGIPEHAWSRSTAATILAGSCRIHLVDKDSLSKRNMSRFRLEAWAADPDAIPRSVLLKIPERPYDSIGGKNKFLTPEGFSYFEHKMVDFDITVEILEVEDMAPSTGPSSWADGAESSIEESA
jgi:hypothetical protein